MKIATLDEFTDVIFRNNGTYCFKDKEIPCLLHYYDQKAYDEGKIIELARAFSNRNSCFNSYYIKEN